MYTKCVLSYNLCSCQTISIWCSKSFLLLCKERQNIPGTGLEIFSQCCFWNRLPMPAISALSRVDWQNSLAMFSLKFVFKCFPENASLKCFLENMQAAMEQALHNVCNQGLSQQSGLRVRLKSCKRENAELQWIAQKLWIKVSNLLKLETWPK